MKSDFAAAVWLSLALAVGCSDASDTPGASASASAIARAAREPRPRFVRPPKPDASDSATIPESSASASAPLAEASSSSAPPPAPAPPKADSARRGLWMWEFDVKGPSAERSAELAAKWGVYRVFIKGSNGDQGPRWWKNAGADNVEAFTKRGIEVWVFGYFYAPDVPDQDGKTWGSIADQVASIAKVAKQPGVKGVVVDAEEEFKDREKDAELLCRSLRAKLKDRAIAYTTYGWLGPNKRFPFKTFDRHCGDAFLPQVYYAFGWPGDVEGSLERLAKDVRAMGLLAPMWPVQSNEKDPSVERMTAFFDSTGPDASIFYMHKDGTSQTAKLGSLRFR